MSAHFEVSYAKVGDQIPNLGTHIMKSPAEDRLHKTVLTLSEEAFKEYVIATTEK